MAKMSVRTFLLDISRTTGVPLEDLYCTQNGRRLSSEDECGVEVSDAPLRWAVRLCGGKGGFGSMLRAIGAQIEKTTNREACRDLSGRRLRDIGEERRLREWAANRGRREEEAERRRQEKLDRLAAPPQFQFKDEAYERARHDLEGAVDEAVEKGLQAAQAGPSKPPQKRKPAKLWIDDEISDLSSSDEEDENSASNESDKSEAPPEKKARLSEPGHSASIAV